MFIKIKKDVFFLILRSFPTLENLYIKDFYKRYGKKRNGQNNLRIILRKNKYIPSDIKITVSYISDIIEIEYTQRYFKRYEFINILLKKSLYYVK